MSQPRSKRRSKRREKLANSFPIFIRSIPYTKYAKRGPPLAQCGTVIALRVLRHGYELPLDPSRSEFRIGRNGPPATDLQLPFPSVSGVHALVRRYDERGLEVTDLDSTNGLWDGISREPSQSLIVFASHSFGLGGEGLLALDEQTLRLVKPLTEFGGICEDVDRALHAVMLGRQLFLRASRPDDVLDLVQLLHRESPHRDSPFIRLDEIPDTEVAIRRLCSKAGHGTVMVDLTRPQRISRALAEILGSPYYDRFWTIMVTPSLDMARECFADSGNESEMLIHSADKLGFPRPGHVLARGEITFTQREC